jgi:hypothetical protein
VQITLQQRRQIGVMPKADYMCFSPLQRKTSEEEKREGEEEYASRPVSRNLRNRRQRLRDLIWLQSSAKKPVKKLFIFFIVLKNDKNSEEIIYFLHCF